MRNHQRHNLRRQSAAIISNHAPGWRQSPAAQSASAIRRNH
jgi:hypothetical protein